MNACTNRVGLSDNTGKLSTLSQLTRVGGMVVLILGCACLGVRADEKEDQYFKIYSVVQEADSLSGSGKTALAVVKYREAQSALLLFQRNNRDWNPKLVSYRLSDLAAKLSAAAEKESGRTDSKVAPVKSATGAEAKAEAGSSTAKVRMLEAGAEPRKLLRLHPKVGDKQALSMTVTVAVETKVGEMATPSMKMPPIKVDLEATVKEIAANGDISYDLVINDAAVQEQEGALPQVVEAMRAAIGGIKNASGTGVTSDRGVNKRAEVKAVGGIDAQARQTFEQMKDSFGRLTVPFPEEEVGAGGRWEVKETVKSQGITFDQTSVCELASVEGDVLKIKSTTTQQAANQKIENPAMPGMKLDLTKMTGKGTGDLVFDLGRLLVTQGKADVQSDLAMGMNMGGQQQAMTVKTDVKVQIEGK